MQQHQKSDRCCLNRPKNDSLMNYFSVAQPSGSNAAHATTSSYSQQAPPLITAALSQLVLEEVTDTTQTVRPPSLPPQAPAEPAPHTNPVINRLQRLQALSESLPNTVPLADAEDDIAKLGTDGNSFIAANLLSSTIIDAEGEYQTLLNPALHIFLGLSSTEIAETIVRR